MAAEMLSELESETRENGCGVEGESEMMSDFESETREDGCGVEGEMISEWESKR
jgi:hypothetical protein